MLGTCLNGGTKKFQGGGGGSTMDNAMEHLQKVLKT